MQDHDDLIYRYLDRDLNADDCAALAGWLAEDASHARQFARLASEQFMVREITRRGVVPPTADGQSELMRSLLSMEQNAQAQTVAWEAPAPKREVRRRVGPAIQPAPATSRAIVIPPWAVAGAVLTAAMIALVVLLQPTPPTSTPAPPPEPTAAADAPAVVEAGLGVVWSGASGWDGLRGDRLPTGPVTLSRGEVTLRFDGGAKVTLIAPCEFSVEDARAIRLASGKAVVESAPWEDGFTLETEHQLIVDRDTTFGVEVLDDATQLQVFRGAVDLYAPSQGGEAGELMARAFELEAYHTPAGGSAVAAAFEVDRYRAAITADFLPVVTRRTLVFREGAGGYRGTADTWFSGRTNPDETAGFAQSTYLRIGRWGDTNQQALIRFDGIFGTDAAQVPNGAQVEQAALVLHNPGTIRDSFGSVSPQGDAFAAYRVLSRWDERDAYAGRPWTAGPTPQVDTDGREADARPMDDCGAMLAEASGYIIPADSRIVVDVTRAVADWARGEANHGLLLQSLGAHPGSVTADREGDALFVASSEYTDDPSLRPALEVTFLVLDTPNP